jgi:hypothetical protein
MEMFVVDGGDDPTVAKGVNGKIQAWREFRLWLTKDRKGLGRPWWERRYARALPDGAADFTINPCIQESVRCTIDGVQYRSQRCDNHKNVKTVGSYFLAKVTSTEGDNTNKWYEVGRATSFFKHIPPGCQDHEGICFTEAKWLVPVLPRCTERSRLPMVLLDNAANRYLQDSDVGDEMITSVWATNSIEPIDVCVLPLDEAHDVPGNVRLQCVSIPNARTALRRYTNRSPNINIGNVNPHDGVRHPNGDVYKLGAVITNWSGISKKFTRPGD